MKLARVILTRFIVVCVVVGGLAGKWFGAYQVVSAVSVHPVVADTPTDIPAQGDGALSSLEGTIRLYGGSSSEASIVYTIEDGIVWLGTGTDGPPVYTFRSGRLVRSRDGEILYFFSDDRVYARSEGMDAAIYAVVGNRAYTFDDTAGEPLFTYRGERVYEGGSTASPIVMTANVNVENNRPLELLIPILFHAHF